MKIDCSIDGKTLTLSLNSNKPLSLILSENIGDSSTVNHCKGKLCGLCAVLIDGKPMLSCMVPAFEIRGKEIMTFSGLQRTKGIKDIEKAYEAVGATPCPDCYESRTMIFEALISDGISEPEEILRELSIIKCSCLDPEDAVNIVLCGMDIRRKRRVRRS